MQEIIMAHTPPPLHNVFDRNKVDWKELEKYGLEKDVFGQSKAFEAMLRGEKSPFVHPITIAEDDGNYQRFYDFISFNRNSDGKIGLQIHVPMIWEEIAVTPFSGYKFSDEDMNNLISTGNLGHIVDLTHIAAQLTKNRKRRPNFNYFQLFSGYFLCFRFSTV